MISLVSNDFDRCPLPLRYDFGQLTDCNRAELPNRCLYYDFWDSIETEDQRDKCQYTHIHGDCTVKSTRNRMNSYFDEKSSAHFIFLFPDFEDILINVNNFASNLRFNSNKIDLFIN